MDQLPIFVTLKNRKVILLGSGEMADAKRRLYERAGAVLTDDEQAQAALAVVAIEDDDEAAAAVKRLKARGLLVNAVDRSALCDYTTPAIIDRDPVLIAIGTGGASAGLAKAIRQRLEQMLPARLGQLAKGLFTARGQIKQRWPDGSDRRRAIDAALNPGGTLDPFADQDADAIDAWLNDPEAGNQTGVVEVTLHSADPDDLTIKQARLLGQADAIYAEKNTPDAVLIRARADAERFDLEAFDATQVTGLTLVIRYS
ncbi:precorrin-2 dehydrogenase/sirohydrochlorin ferrochelatase family protein [Parasphingorhabdus cellanae]|uniref:precorrin-2 dehydrogenase n=1 Tax=Parasphingorhabdus cellanae TaxID=2806553 RepID=A0ABX7T3Z0_9SPHN|nr:bifunctional precorrin-2 dehydrogenase/sirohydrochlorin ferrochelatase [Parasphingorhabdus cellanae]QTD55262.1 siroheme synthase [Parasphingorhabdus cellanae]